MSTALAARQSAPLSKEVMKAQGCEIDSFLPRLQLVTTSSDLFKQRKVKDFDVWVLVDSSGSALTIGAELTCVLIESRPLAVDFKTEERYYDTECDEFKDIMNRSKADPANANCAFGNQHLVWVPEKDTFATIWFHNWSSKVALTEAFNLCPLDDYRFSTYSLGVAHRKSKKTDSEYALPLLRFNMEASTPDLDKVALDKAINQFFADMQETEAAAPATEASNRAR